MTTLINYPGARFMTRDDLDKIPDPPSLGRTHKPIPHRELVRALTRAIEVRDLDVVAERFYVQDGARDFQQVPGALIFGVFGIRPRSKALRALMRPGMTFALGFRSGNNKKMRLEIVSGAHVAAADSFAFAPDMIAFNKRHTQGLDLDAELTAALNSYLVQQVQMVERIDRATATTLGEDRAKALILDVLDQGVLPARYLGEIQRNYFKPAPAMRDCQGRSLWALHNACTRVLAPVEKDPAFNGARVERFAPRMKFEATRQLGALILDADGSPR